MRTYKIQWRGKVTRDVGEDECLAASAAIACEEYEKLHPYRQVTHAVHVRLKSKRTA